MGRKRMPGLRQREGIWHINGKRICGQAVYQSTGESSLEKAEQYVARLIEERRQATIYGVRPRRTFKQAAIKFLEENMHLSSITDSAINLKLLEPIIGNLYLDQICDETLSPFVKARYKDGVKASTINRGLEIVRRILNLSARKWREQSLTWLETPPLITMEPMIDASIPFTLSWKAQHDLFKRLPDHLAVMCLYAANTGCREQEVCRLRWEWEVEVPALGRSVFVIPGDHIKNSEDRLVVLNDIAWSVIQGQRGLHDEFVFVYRSNKGKVCRPVTKMNNTAWKRAWREAELPVDKKYKRGVHNLRHTFGRRLRAAGVSLETRKVLMGHTNGDITTHYSAPELAELLTALNSISSTETGSMPSLTMLEIKSGKSRALEKLERKSG